MDIDLPTDLINRAQIGFREAVGLSLFDRNDINLPSIWTVEASIATLDPSPSYLRCQFCQCKLLRGLQSMICIYCGEYQKNDLNPDVISFNSTLGYNWLLQSLNFNGSEPVGSLAEGSGIDGGQGPAEDELTLSELLDLKISWRTDPTKPKNNYDFKTSENNDFFRESKRGVVSDVPEEQPVSSKANQNKTFEDHDSFTSDWNAEFHFANTKMENENLGTLNFDFFKESKRSVVSGVPEEQPVASKADQNKTFKDQESLTSDWNTEFQFANTKMENENLGAPNFDFFTESRRRVVSDVHDEQPVDQSKTFKDLESFTSDRNAEFQFADTKMENEDLGTLNFDFFKESKRSVVSGVPEEQPVASKADQNKTFKDQESLTSDWNTEFQFANTKMENDNLDAPNFDFFTESRRSVVSDVQEEQPVDQNKTFKNLESFTSDWNAEFQFADTKMVNEDLQSVVPHVGADADLSAHIDMIFGKKENNKKPIGDSDLFQDDLLPDMNSGVQAKDGLSGDLNGINSKNVDLDWFSDGSWQKISVKNMDTIKDDNLLDIKPQIDPVSFRSGNTDLDKSDTYHSEVTDWFQDDGGFDKWNDFTSSTGNQNSFRDSWMENINEKAGTSEKISELNLFPSTDDSQEVDFGKFLQSDIFSGDKNPSDTRAAYDMFSEIPMSNRNATTEAGNSVEGPKSDEITPNAIRPENDVKLLMSQMHDLSFMLKNELSIPSKPEDLDPSHI